MELIKRGLKASELPSKIFSIYQIGLDSYVSHHSVLMLFHLWQPDSPDLLTGKQIIYKMRQLPKRHLLHLGHRLDTKRDKFD